jgi:hypothetical protein
VNVSAERVREQILAIFAAWGMDDASHAPRPK